MDLSTLSRQVVELLAKNQEKLALAESCTAGLIAASLGCVPGVSQHFCGSAVVYREQTKIDWLQVDAQTIESSTAVSEETTYQIAEGVLLNTTEATISLGITGHLGPGSPSELDGRIFTACFRRQNNETQIVAARTYQLHQATRLDRQRESAEFALQQLIECLSVD